MLAVTAQSEPSVRPPTEDEFPRILELNNGALPAVSPLEMDALRHLIAESVATLVVEVDNNVVGFVITLGPGADYDSINYGFFDDRHSSFLYVDRIVIDSTTHSRGLGRRLYDAVLAETADIAAVFCCEVNTRPRNEQSLRFHEKYGFVEVGQQDYAEGTKTVSLLEKKL